MKIGVEIGGTFTDVILAGDGQAPLAIKAPSTPEDPSIGAIDGIKRLLEKSGRNLGEVDEILHGSTVATNALIEARAPAPASSRPRASKTSC
jgi:N-methylhydantoinase A/oxoprolinase/acetone carboxylase beta subunit